MFCIRCMKGIECMMCDKTFDQKKKLKTTSVHQISKDITVYNTEVFTEMITDLGCPNSVIGAKDVNRFVDNLSEFQKENLEIIKVDENFKFGPSGPFNCSEKLRFPLKYKTEVLWVDIAIVKADIPMLLGNNVLKPLEAEIKLFATGGRVLALGGAEIDLRGTKGGHYTIKVSDLGQLSDVSGNIELASDTSFTCEMCDKNFKDDNSLNVHKKHKHTKPDIGCQPKEIRSALKKVFTNAKENDIANIKKDVEGDNSREKVITDLNTLLNTGSPSKREKKLIQITKNLVQLNCDKCEQNFKTENENAYHNSEVEGNEKSFKSVFLSHHEEEDLDELDIDPMKWNVFLSETDCKELLETEKKDILKLHKYFAHRNGKKLWDNIFQPAGRLSGKKKLILDFLDRCEVCRKYRRKPSRPKVGLPKSRDVNDVVSIDLKILKKSGNKDVAILYLHDEFSKLTKGQVINDKNPDTIIKAIENKWIIGGGIGPGHPTRGFFSDNGGEFLNESLIDFASALDITIRMTAANSPWMNGGCERAHATVDRTVEKILEDEPKLGIQKAVDLACFVKNTEINKTGFSPMQLFCGRSPSFPGYSDCSPGSIELDGNNEYLAVLRRIDNARVAARQIDCNQRIKIALKSRINKGCEKSYNIGDSIWFKIDSSNKWKSGMVLGQQGKVLFIKYGNFIRRVSLDVVVPAEQTHDQDDEPDQDDVDNDDRLQDDNFDHVELVAKKEAEIENLRKSMIEQQKIISQLEDNSRMINSNRTVETDPSSSNGLESNPNVPRQAEIDAMVNPWCHPPTT